MPIRQTIDDRVTCVRFSEQEDGKEIARARLMIIYNDLHEEPYGVLEDVFVEKDHRGKGLGTIMAREAVEEAKRRGCYKVLAQSRYGREHVHRMYQKIGLCDYGKNFRLDLL